MLAPICLFTYNRLYETQQTVEALKLNGLAKESHLVIFSDGPKNETAFTQVTEVRKYLGTITGFKSIELRESPVNKGLANSIIDGVTQVIKKYDKVIVLEDDLVTSPNFLDFMSFCLDNYKHEVKIFSISGFSVKIIPPADYHSDLYFYERAHSWGWATWKDRWETVDWEIKDYQAFKNIKKNQHNFNKLGSDLTKMLISSKTGKISSWYIRFAYNQFKQQRLSVYPISSKVMNIGFMENATNCNTYNRITIDFDKGIKTIFKAPVDTMVSQNISRQRYKYKSLTFRIIGKFLTILMKFGVINQRKNT